MLIFENMGEVNFAWSGNFNHGREFACEHDHKPRRQRQKKKKQTKKTIQTVTIVSEVGINGLNLRRAHNHFEITKTLNL